MHVGKSVFVFVRERVVAVREWTGWCARCDCTCVFALDAARGPKK